jgi:hypothetical protein
LFPVRYKLGFYIPDDGFFSLPLSLRPTPYNKFPVRNQSVNCRRAIFVTCTDEQDASGIAVYSGTDYNSPLLFQFLILELRLVLW